MSVMPSSEPLLSLENLSKDYPRPAPMRARRLFSRFGGLHVEEGLASTAMTGQQVEDDDDEDEMVVEDPVGDELLLGREASGPRVIDGVTLQADGTSVVAVVGPAGAGKTVLLKLIGGLVPPSEGRVVVRGTVAPALNVLALVLPAKGHTVKAALPQLGAMVGISPRVVRSRFDQITELMQAPGLLKSSTSFMESRRKRELILAMALSVAPDVLLLDIPLPRSPFGDRCMRRVEDLRGSGTLVVAEMQDLRKTRLEPDRVVTLDRGRVVDAGSP